MTAAVSILVPRENVNDESATLVAWLVDDGAHVEEGRPVAQIETSKAVVEVLAPASGTIHHRARPGQDVPIGEALGTVGGAGASAASPPIEAPAHVANGSVHADSRPLAPSVRRLVAESNVDPDAIVGTGRGGRITKGDVLARIAEGPDAEAEEPPPPPRSSRFSKEARELIARLGLDPKSFEGRGLVRATDVAPTPKAQAAPTTAPIPSAPAKPAATVVPASGIAVRTEALSRAKRTEGKYLRSGFEATLASVITVGCPTRGFRDAFGAEATALIAFEAARLLRKYPAFNAFHQDGDVSYYEEVNVGFAVDAGRGLKVAVVRGADRKGVGEIASEMQDLVVAYLDDKLPVEALSGGTFTITDLSGEGVVAFHPLINRGQSAILGICAEQGGAFNLVLAFDHQVAEGRLAAKFLGDLRDRLVAHEASANRGPVPGDPRSAEEPRCSRCQATVSELGERHPLLQVVRPDGSTRPVCILCIEGWN